MDLTALNLAEIRDLVRRKAASAEEIALAHLERIKREDGNIAAFLTLSPERAFTQAARVDRALARGEPVGPLAGVPVAVKDVIVTRGVRTTCGSRILEHYVPPYDATAVVRLEAAGACILGKTNCDEFAMGSSTENSGYFPTRNPHDPSRVPGGSSGGSAAAVAANLATVALGSDTGGSIRQPAALCGVAGLMGTYGRVSRYGLVAFASSLDHIGPFGRSVRDLAAVLQAIAGRDPNDSTSADVPVPDYEGELEVSVAGLRVGVPREYFAGLSAEIGDPIQRGIDLLQRIGCEIVPVSLPHTDYAIACYYIVATAEASSNLARYDGVRYGLRAPDYADLRDMYERTRDAGFGAEVKRRIMLGTYALSSGYYDAYYLKAQKVRSLLARDFSEAFQAVDVIVTPTSPVAAFKIGERSEDPLQMYLADIYTVTASLSGIPGISVPCGKTKGDVAAGVPPLPVGMQFVGRHFDEARLLGAAYAFERAGGFEGG
ncbi:MAG TPA: Asp-tRNA(Asn)/Glu-tRNA(Gln) amidotransferase subunit GatA [Terriglobia bacterium]|jgi:aspartyl-tRNA(Asn)/glutamyl-tRNA(Gln) amidotransferase subunit A|nr:Asp-tRNA(Asn)/Glu-tRNA(Gln) amidotransferase subunit GatA [Terriglobia bacterium]